VKTLLIAHRGAQEIVPENTLTAFQLAIKNGFRAIECDVQLTKDGHLVIIHDETVNRTTDGKGWVSQLTWSEIEALHVMPDERIPSLSKAFYTVVVAHKRKFIVEIKADSPLHSKQVAAKLALFIRRVNKKYYKYIEVHSFWYEALKEFKAACPAIVTGAIINGGFEGKQIVAIAKDTGANGVSLGYEFLSNRVVRECHKAGLFVDTWAISDGTVLHRIRPLGINAVVENFTGKIIR
jgi:glycerophosphoryl diester phosphodiesterase